MPNGKVKKSQPKNCWEYWSCPPKTRNRCLVYKVKAGDSCWYVAGFYAQAPRKFKFCWRCPWNIKQLNGWFISDKAGNSAGA